MTTRIPCCVPFCKRTAPRRLHPDAEEVICSIHYRRVPHAIRKLHKRLQRRLDDLWERNNGTMPEHQELYITRLVSIDSRLWQRIKAKAIEAAGGIG